MTYKDKPCPSLKSKLALAMLTLSGVVFAIWHLTDSYPKNPLQNWILILCTLIFYVRLVICLFVFIKRKVGWFEGITVGILYGIMVAMFSVWRIQKSSTVDFGEFIGFVIFFVGSIINSLSDYQRHLWKNQPKNQGQLYTQGLFRYAMHINFLGDSIMFIGFAIVTQNAMSFIPVLFIVLNFILFQIPQLDTYLKNKYGDDFVKYAEKTKKFIPFIY
jgi:protein-S-isoprenylcysteine O-methyltransferase Ste14